MEPSPKLSPLEASEAIGVHRQTVYSLISKGTLPARKIGKRLVVDREDLERFLASTVVTPESTSVVKEPEREGPKTCDWFLVCRDRKTKGNFWFTSDELSALPQAQTPVCTTEGEDAVNFHVGPRSEFMKLRYLGFTTQPTGSKG